MAAAPVDSEIRDDFVRSIINGYLNHDTGHRQLRLIAVGEAGQGKSALVNALLGEEQAAVGKKLNSGTKKVEEHIRRDEIAVVWDTPGFGFDDPEKDRQKVESMARECEGKVDLILYCISMASSRWPAHSDIVTIRMMTVAFGPEIWRYCQFVLTFANQVAGLCEEGDDFDQFFSEKVWEFEENVRMVLKEHAHLPEEEIEEIHVVAVGDPRPHRRNKSWKLPTTDDWFVDLWVAVSHRIQQSALSTLIKLNRHHIVINDESLNPPEVRLQHTLAYHPLVTNGEQIQVPDASLSLSREPTPSPSLAHPDDFMEQEIPHEHSIPLYRIVYEQLKKSDSAFKQYIKFYWEQEGQKVKGFGHVKGLMEGLCRWIQCKCSDSSTREEADTFTSSL